ncbi:glycosyltransferase [Balneolales bacterium ANBcel1]|nr:glycosyltransferase [Balneolales bacterium ANBcel1]
MLYSLLFAINVLVLGYFFIVNLVYMILIAASYRNVRKYRDVDQIFKMTGVYSTNLYKPVSIIAPAFNEEQSIIHSVNALLNLKYANLEVVVVNDGSSDDTLQKLIDYYKLKPDRRYRPRFLEHKPIRQVYSSPRYPALVVVDKVNGRKADALNAGLNIANNDLICAVDADSMLEPDVIVKMLRVFMEDENTIAVGGVIRVANGCTYKHRMVDRVLLPKTFLGRIQAVEYLRAFLFGRVGWDYFDSLLVISGAFGVFDRKAVIKAGGYLHDTVGEDMELVVRLHKYHRDNDIPYRIRFISEPVCWTEVPEDRKTLAKQRNRWHRGLADSLFRHRDMMLRPSYGKPGMVAMPFFVFGELLAPVIELSGFILVGISLWMGAINVTFALLFLTFAIVLGMILSISAVLLEEMTTRRYDRPMDVVVLAVYALFENFGYRQLHAWWRLKGLVDYLKGNKEWGTMVRKGIGK